MWGLTAVDGLKAVLTEVRGWRPFSGTREVFHSGFVSACCALILVFFFGGGLRACRLLQLNACGSVYYGAAPGAKPAAVAARRAALSFVGSLPSLWFVS